MKKYIGMKHAKQLDNKGRNDWIEGKEWAKWWNYTQSLYFHIVHT